MLRFLLLFALILIALFAAELLEPVQKGLVQPWTALLASSSAALVQAFDSDVVAEGVVLRSAGNGFGVAVAPGCNGVEASIILIAAMLAFSAPWRHKFIGIGLGLLAVQGLNLVRIISLFYLGQWRADAFEFAHLYLWQALIMLDVLVVWLVWAAWLLRGRAVRMVYRWYAPRGAGREQTRRSNQGYSSAFPGPPPSPSSSCRSTGTR